MIPWSEDVQEVGDLDVDKQVRDGLRDSVTDLESGDDLTGWFSEGDDIEDAEGEFVQGSSTRLEKRKAAISPGRIAKRKRVESEKIEEKIEEEIGEVEEDSERIEEGEVQEVAEEVGGLGLGPEVD